MKPVTLILTTAVLLSPMANAQTQLETEAIARESVVRTKVKNGVIESLKQMTVTRIREMGTAGQIEPKLVPQFESVADKAAMLAGNQADYVDRFNAMAETRAKELDLESSPVSIPVRVKTLSPALLPEYEDRFTGAWASQKEPVTGDTSESGWQQNSEEWCRFRNLSQNRDPVIRGLVKMAKERWGVNYSMIVHHVEKSYDSYKRGDCLPDELKYVAKELAARPAAAKPTSAPASAWSGKGMPPGMMRR